MNTHMRKSGKVALRAISNVHRGLRPDLAWDQAWSDEDRPGRKTQRKYCPRGAFLGLVDAGLLIGADPGGYARRLKTSHLLAIAGVQLLRQDSSLASDPDSMWQLLKTEQSTHNGQMDVVAALWNEGHIVAVASGELGSGAK